MALKQVALYLTAKDHLALITLSKKTRIPIAVYLREAVTDLLAKYTDGKAVKVKPKQR